MTVQCAGKSVLDCLQAFHLRRVDAVKKEIAVIENNVNLNAHLDNTIVASA